MVSTRSGIRRETPFTNSHPHPAAMTDTLQQLQNYIAEMKWCHEKELTRLKAYHDQLETHVIHPKGDEPSSHTLPEHTQGESHPWRTNNTTDDLNPSYMHRPATRTVRQYPFVNHIMEADIPLWWKPLNLERYDGTTDPDEHLDTFLTQANLYTNDNVTMCRVFPTSLKGLTLTWYGGFPPKSIGSFDTPIKRFSV